MLDTTELLDILETNDNPVAQIGSTSDFSGGMVRLNDPLKIQENQYFFLKNGRVRFGNVEPVKFPKLFRDNVPTGKYQGVYGLGQYLILFVNGTAWFKNENNVNSAFSNVPGFIRMSEDIDTIYAEAVPASFNNTLRTSQGTNLSSRITGNPAALVCQDGERQPNLILPNLTSRPAKKISEWSIDNPEYVPIGRQMLYKDGILYVLRDAKILRSLEGRPLDFVIAIDENGNRLPIDSGLEQEADRLSHRVSFDDLIAIGNLNIPPTDNALAGAFLVTTGKFSWMVVPNYSRTVFGEPTFRNVDLFPTGSNNQFSIVNKLGDIVFIDSVGFKSFNAISQFTNDGLNSPFSKTIHSIFKNKVQSSTAAIVFDNYLHLGVDTIYGPAIVIYDELLDVFVSLDIFSNVEGNIKQFAEVVTDTGKKLYFITDANKLYQYYEGEGYDCELYTKEWYSGRSSVEQQLKRVGLTFINVQSPGGTVEITDYVDRKEIRKRVATVNGGTVEEDNITNFPFGSATTTTTEPISFKVEDSPRGIKVGLKIKFNFKTELSLIELHAKLYPVFVTNRQKSRQE